MCIRYILSIFWDMTLCTLVRRLPMFSAKFTLNMGLVVSSEMPVNFCRITGHNMAENISGMKYFYCYIVMSEVL
jgi:hypothetical protein